MHPILVQIGPLSIRYYSLMIIIGIVVGIFIARSNMRLRGHSPDAVLDFIVYAVPAGIIGARLYYVIFNWDYYGRNPSEIAAIWHGGLAIHGAIIAGVIVGFLFSRRKGFGFWELADSVAPALILGQTFGRFGNFMNGDAHGVPTDLPWGVVFPPGTPAGNQYPDTPTHPVMIYELIINFLAFIFLWSIRKKHLPDGTHFLLYLSLYSIGRFFMEFFRGDSLMLGPLRMAQIIGVAIVIGSSILLYRRYLMVKTGRTAKGKKRLR